jgi:hypothetical protein
LIRGVVEAGKKEFKGGKEGRGEDDEDHAIDLEEGTQPP